MLVQLQKMSSELDENGKVSYFLSSEEGPIGMNALLGRQVSFRFTGKIRCISCGGITKKSFGQGYCYRCFIKVPETEECVLRPHLCQAHLGIARDMEYARQHCLIEHYVYLAVSGGLKVGVTRNTQIPTRWIDQGASRGMVIAKTPNRYLAGCIEVELMKKFSDKTNWRLMLANSNPAINLGEEREKAHGYLSDDLALYCCNDGIDLELSYPVLEYPTKVTSLNFDKDAEVNGILVGIRGQYLIFEGGRVLNIRTFSGYEVVMAF